MARLLPHLEAVQVEQLVRAEGVLSVVAHSRDGREYACPVCGTPSRRVHSRYGRRLADAPVGGCRSVIELSVRRLFCDNSSCTRVTFAEQIEGLTFFYGRRTPLLRALLEAIGVALAGRAGGRLTDMLGAPVDRSVLLRLVMALPDPPVGTPRVLGVDDFATRKGHVYGTLLVDAETHAPIDMLQGREAGPLARWLSAHPGIEIICWDRLGSYSDAARTAAPSAIQVADKWHIWNNLGKATERCVTVHRRCLPPWSPEVGPQQADINDSEEAFPASHQRTVELARTRWRQVHDLLDAGMGIRAIAHWLGWGRHTVQRYARAARWQDQVTLRPRRTSALDPHADYLRQRWENGNVMIEDLQHELHEQGFDVSYSTLRDWISRILPPRAAPPAPPPRPPTVRQVTGWLTRHPDTLREEETRQLKITLAACPELATAHEHIRALGQMLQNRQAAELPAWIEEVTADELPGLTGFAKGLATDLDAVTAGFTISWSSGVVEGRISDLKMLKRQMFNRAGLPLLRKRVLLVAASRRSRTVTYTRAT
ncbi:Transposase (plasmid) [Streptomyces sp. YIM 121038]|uniref:ISL3 family transposase n=1 Tax=Streptomyces sp. YIM 121038 TaxID=2136401 RepID=UPI0011109D0D|nr:ISL3 family transposase [Streptomyces sp. YIM 121038]QCX82960.1 Transposase [Streptomyces sp. YIM 121038]